MITGELKNKIDSLWDIFAAGGLTNPLGDIEQITNMTLTIRRMSVMIHTGILLLSLFAQAEMDSYAHLVISLSKRGARYFKTYRQMHGAP